MADVQSLSAEDPRSLGRYELLGRLGEGAQGIVFLGRDPEGAQVAVKLLRAHLSQNEASRSRFLQEVSAAKRVARFCTAQVLDADLAGTQPYIVSEFIPGPSLAAVVRAEGPRSGTALERIAVNTATALAGIHQAGVVHRDFKAANVLLGPDGPVVIDFGIAKALDAVDSELTLPGQSPGTPGYMAPEQFGEGPVGPPADIFAWGVTIAFAATGGLPFGTGQLLTVMYRILNEQPQLNGLTPPLHDLVAGCLEKEPANRPVALEIVDRLLGREQHAGAAAPAMPSPSSAWTPAGTPARAEQGAAPAPSFGEDLTSGADPVRAGRMRRGETSQPFDVAAEPTPAAKPKRGAELTGIAVAIALVLLIGGAVAVKALTGSSRPQKSSQLHAAAAALPSESGVAASPVVSPSQRGKKRPARPRPTRSRASGGSASGQGASTATTAVGTSGGSAAAPTSAAPQPTSAPQPTPSSTPNPYTPTEVCGSSYYVIDSHALSGGTIYLLYDSATGYNCVTTMKSDISGKTSMVATLSVQGGPTSTDSGDYTYYAGPVALKAAATCVEWGGTIGSSSWESSWSHCG